MKVPLGPSLIYKFYPKTFGSSPEKNWVLRFRALVLTNQVFFTYHIKNMTWFTIFPQNELYHMGKGEEKYRVLRAPFRWYIMIM